jgi:hypothetical protein
MNPRLLLSALIVTAIAAASVTLAEMAERNGKGVSDDKRLYGAGFIKPFAGGLASVGDRTLSYLAPGARKWTTLHQQPGSLYRVGLDEGGARLLAVWERDTVLHYFTLQPRRHVRLSVPSIPPSWDRRFSAVHSLAFAPNGRDALIFLNGPAGTNTINYASRAFRAKLDAAAEPELLFEVGNGLVLWTSARGAVYILPARPDRVCGWDRCEEGAIVAFDITDGGVLQRRLYGKPQPGFNSVRVAGGSDPERLVLLLTDGYRHAILRYRWGEADALYQQLPPGLGPHRGVGALAPNAEEIVYIIERGLEFEIVRRALPPGDASSSMRLWAPGTPRPDGDLQRQYINGYGVRADGSVWVHLDNDMALIDANGVARRVNLEPLFGKKTSWAGVHVYREKPEGMWIGVEVGGGRDFVWVSFADLEKHSTPWPVRDPNAPLPVSTKPKHNQKCLPPDVRIATPSGDVPVSELSKGMAVWTRDPQGNRVAGIVLSTNRVQVAGDHKVVRLRLADGRVLPVSAGHPLPEGFGAEQLRAGDSYDGSTILEARMLTYDRTETHDILPSGPTGVYWANGIPLASTLGPR